MDMHQYKWYNESHGELLHSLASSAQVIQIGHGKIRPPKKDTMQLMVNCLMTSSDPNSPWKNPTWDNELTLTKKKIQWISRWIASLSVVSVSDSNSPSKNPTWDNAYAPIKGYKETHGELLHSLANSAQVIQICHGKIRPKTRYNETHGELCLMSSCDPNSPWKNPTWENTLTLTTTKRYNETHGELLP